MAAGLDSYMQAALQAARAWLRRKAAAAQALSCIACSLRVMLRQHDALLEPRQENEALMVCSLSLAALMSLPAYSLLMPTAPS